MILEYKKETKLFSLYIPKWRVPEEVPRKITVKLDEVVFYVKEIESYNVEEVEINNELRNKKITAKIIRICYHSKTIRYDLINKEKAEICSPYIPKSLLEHDMDEILM